MEYRGIRYTIRAGIERGQWYVTIYPAGVEMNARVVVGLRKDAHLQACDDQELAEKALRRKIEVNKVKLTPGVSPEKEPQAV